MDDYINRKAFLEHMSRTNRYFDVKFDIDEFPAADVAPVVHGRWKLLHKGDWTSVFICSVCGRRETIAESEAYNSALKMPKKYPYCHCGARMDGTNNKKLHPLP